MSLRCSLASIAFLALAAGAKASGDQNLFPVSRGSTWLFQTTIVGTGKVIEQRVNIVSSTRTRGATEALFRYTSEGLTIQEETYVASSAEVSRKKSSQGGSGLLSPPMPIIRYPLGVGKSWKWTGTLTMTSPQGQSVKAKGSADLRVSALDSVKTPAGTFKAYRVDLHFKASAGGTSQTVDNSYWFAAGVGYVKQVLTIQGQRIEGILLSYKIAPVR